MKPVRPGDVLRVEATSWPTHECREAVPISAS